MGRGNMLLGTRCPKSICTNIPGAHSVRKKKKKREGKGQVRPLFQLYISISNHILHFKTPMADQEQVEGQRRGPTIHW